MNWEPLNFDWNAARAFLVTAEEGSFSAAAICLGVTQSTLSRQVSSLEESMGVSLFERTVRGIQLTESGRELLKHVTEMAYSAGQFTQSVDRISDTVTGKVTITAPEGIAFFYLPKVAVALKKHAPGIDLEIIATDKIVDLKNREADIAIRLIRPQEPDLIVRRLCTIRSHFYAAKSYLATLDKPVTPETIDSFTVLGFEPKHPIVEAKSPAHAKLNITPPTLKSSNGLVLWELIRSGAGIGMMSEDIGDQEDCVERVFDDFPTLDVDFYLVVHRELRTSKRLQIVFEFLVDKLSN